MSNLLLGFAFQVDLEPSLKLVLMGLCDAANDDGGNCFPAVATLARKASVSSRQAQRNLKTLRANDWCWIEGNEAGGRLTRRYRINAKKLREKADEAMRDDKLSPLKQPRRSAAEECRVRHSKDDASDTSGVTSASPELSVELSDKKTTTARAIDLAWPLQLDQQKVVVVRGLIQELDQQLQQALLDELAGAYAIGKPPKRVGSWMKELVHRTRPGAPQAFVPDLGLAVAAERARRAQDAVQREAARVAEAERRKRAQDPQARERTKAIIAAAVAELSDPD
jgi:hypothetical protein